MSVIMTMRMKGDAAALERYAASNQDAMAGIVERAKGHGLIAHRFYGNDEGEIMVVDEWPSFENFQTFFDEAAGEIGPMMQAAGITDEPHPQAWRKLEVHDEYGWDA